MPILTAKGHWGNQLITIHKTQETDHLLSFRSLYYCTVKKPNSSDLTKTKELISNIVKVRSVAVFKYELLVEQETLNCQLWPGQIVKSLTDRVEGPSSQLYFFQDGNEHEIKKKKKNSGETQLKRKWIRKWMYCKYISVRYDKGLDCRKSSRMFRDK